MTANVLEHLGDEFEFPIVTSDRDVGDYSPYPVALRVAALARVKRPLPEAKPKDLAGWWRKAITETIVIGNATIAASIGFDETGRPAEVFLSGAKDGSGMAAILDDASVVISVALQHGISAAALAKSIARIPENLEGPAIKPASPIGAALDLLVDYEASQNG